MSIFLPALNEQGTSRDMISEFQGYNHNLRIRENEFYEMENMSAEDYPILTPRVRRAKVRKFTEPNGLFSHDGKLAWVDGTGFYYDGALKGTVSNGEKQFVSMGALIVIFPDKKYYNTKTGELLDMEQSRRTTGTVSATLCKLDGTAYTGMTVSATAPSNPKNGALWIDTSVTPHVLKEYSDTSKMWVSVPTTYVKIAAAGIGTGFQPYDGVKISGMADPKLNGDFILYGAADGYIVVTAMIDKAVSQTAAVTVSRSVPDMDYVCENENRLWGCSSENHEIYACKLGDPSNWRSFLGIATDSYAATVGSGGNFTGCCAHLGYVLFFKEDVIHKLYGSKPSNFQLTNVNARGVQAGCANSMAIVDETLYYKARGGVCAYNSALPSSVSEALGKTSYGNAAAGKCGTRYFISMSDESGRYSLFVYDTQRGTWSREDETRIKYFAALGTDLYFIDAKEGALYSVCGNATLYADSSAAREGKISWRCETGDLGMGSPDNKYLSKLGMRMEVDAEAAVKIEVQYDSEAEWVEVYRQEMTRKRSISVPFIPRRCDHLRLRLSGTGETRLYSITKTMEQGSDT